MRRRRVEEKNFGSGISLKGRRLVRDRFQIWQEKERIGQRELERFDQFDQFLKQQ
jgi:hypothetical protein